MSLQNVTGFCSRRRCHTGARFTPAQCDGGIGCLAPAPGWEALQAPSAGSAVDSSSPGGRADSGASPDRAGMKASLQPPLPQAHRPAVPAPCALGQAARPGAAFQGAAAGGWREPSRRESPCGQTEGIGQGGAQVCLERRRREAR